jgi:putative transcriptional regulator
MFKAGDFLIATPTIFGDPNFQRSGILLADCKNSGAVGFIMNKKLDYHLDDLMEGVTQSFPIFNGGPVDQDKLFVVHKLGGLIPNSLPIAHDLYWSGDFETVLNLIELKKVSPAQIRFFLGYSGWSEGQLESEIKEDSWVVIEGKQAKNWMEDASEDFWKHQMRSLGGSFLIWSNAPENPMSN